MRAAKALFSDILQLNTAPNHETLSFQTGASPLINLIIVVELI
jgi:hypothetical protein